jgi:hypothetical protein
VSKKEGIVLYEKEKGPKPNTDIGIEPAERLINIISKAKQGNVYPEIIEWLEGYQVIKYIKKENCYYIIDSVSIPKKSYDDWFWKKASMIPVRIYDNKLRDELLKEVSWAGRLNYQ